jgi:hypothetical protein
MSYPFICMLAAHNYAGHCTFSALQCHNVYCRSRAKIVKLYEKAVLCVTAKVATTPVAAIVVTTRSTSSPQSLF